MRESPFNNGLDISAAAHDAMRGILNLFILGSRGPAGGGWRRVGVGELLAGPGQYVDRAKNRTALSPVRSDPKPLEVACTIVAGTMEGASRGGMDWADAVRVVRGRSERSQLSHAAAWPW